MDNVRFGVVGLGGMGQNHIKHIENTDETTLTAVCDVDRPTVKEVAGRFNVAGYADYRRLLNSGKVDAVLIATPHYFHPPVAVYAMNRGIHVLSEKPVAVSVKAADKMVAAARKSGCVFSVMFQYRSLPIAQAARRIVDQGRLGELRRTMLVSLWLRTRAYYESATWRATWRGEGGGVLLNQSPHHLDLFTWLGGMPRTVRGRIATNLHDIEVEEEASALLEYANGATGYVYSSVNACPERYRIELCGDRGRLLIEDDRLAFYEHEQGIKEFIDTAPGMWDTLETRRRPVRPPSVTFGQATIIRNTARAILYGEPLIVPGDEAVGSLELANAITLSGMTGRKVKVPINRDRYETLLEGLRRTGRRKKVVREQRVTDPTHV